MPRFAIERQYLVPVYEHILVEASVFEEACRLAVDEGEQPWGDDARVDYESARSTTVVRAVELSEPVQAYMADERALSYLLYEAGLDPLPIPREFADEGDRPGAGVGFV